MQIYSRLVTNGQTLPYDHNHLHMLAKEAQTAARCYFEGIGVIQEKEDEVPDSGS